MGIAISTLLGARATNERTKLPRTKMKLSNDIWLDVLKFLTCAVWSEKRYVSRQISGIAERNISRLPRAIIEKVTLNENCSEPKLVLTQSDVDNPIVAFGAIIPQSEIAQWFVNRGITLKARIQFRPLFTRIQSAVPNERPAFGGYFSDFADICIRGPAQQVQKSWFHQLFGKQYESILFYAQISPSRKFSWPAMEQFLTFIFHPLSYIKMVEMYSVNQRFVDAVKGTFADNFAFLEIRCLNVDGLSNTLTWLEQNVRADSIQMPFVTIYTQSQNRDAVCRLLSDFVFGALRICAKRELRIHSETGTNLLISLAEKFRTLPQIECEIPTIVIESFFLSHLEEMQPNLGPNVIHQEIDSHGAKFLYVFENGHNRMRISFCEKILQDYFVTNNWTEYDCYVKFYATELLL